ncbi:response regulator [Flavobacterium sp. D11R37]|uniref:response regulator n=1 Tax=Flavobacterium coralii TaxID=2838017 RepID=UPI001CA71B7D|nr:response regulator [Flavobacterium coralii]MBY8961613.1 response regulator [Flavobacterium coralii]
MEKKKILIVDDDPRNIFALSATLKAKGYSNTSCTGAEEAITLLRGDETVDCILMDMMMPDLDGYEAIPIIRDIPARKNTPVIAVTAQAMVGDREKCLEAGADGYISKPIDVDKLLEILSAL